jgi:hypothetical protein
MLHDGMTAGSDDGAVRRPRDGAGDDGSGTGASSGSPRGKGDEGPHDGTASGTGRAVTMAGACPLAAVTVPAERCAMPDIIAVPS